MIRELPQTGYTVSEATRLIGFSPTSKHIYKVIRSGELESFIGADGRLRISREELYSYLKQREQQRQ
jgi:predicted site-specific integrase-resolvase